MKANRQAAPGVAWMLMLGGALLEGVRRCFGLIISGVCESVGGRRGKGRGGRTGETREGGTGQTRADITPH